MPSLGVSQQRAQPIVGREREMERLSQIIRSVQDGEKRGVMLIGAAGIGKTTLLRWTLERAREVGFLCASVRAPAAAGLPPLFPLTTILQRFFEAIQEAGSVAPTALQRLLETVSGAGGEDSYPVQVPQLAEALEGAAHSAPLFLRLDDYQWAPEAGTGLLLSTLRIVEVPLLLLCGYRWPSEEAATQSELPAPSADLWIEAMEVPPLSPEATLALAQNELGGEVLPSVAESLHQRTRGHPLFATETLRRWRDTNRIAPIANRWAFSGDGSNDSSGTLDDLLRYRARGVSSEARSVLHLLSVVSRVTGFEELKALARLQHEHLVEAITELAEMGLITVRAGAEAGYALAHPLLEAAVRNSLGSVRTGDLHERVFRVLSSRREAGSAVPASELAHHAVAALEAPGDLPELVSAAALEASSAGSHLEEATWFGKLAEIVKDPNRKREAIQNQARAAINFDPRWAIDLFTQSLQHELPEVERAHALLGRAQAWRITGCLEEALNDLTHALPMASSDDMFDIQHSRAYLTALTGDIEAGERILVDLAQGEVRESTPFKILGHLGSFAFARSDLLAARRLWEMALRSCGERGYRAFLLHNLGWACMLLGEWNIAQALADEAIRMARESGDAWNLVAILAADARLESWRGDTARALDLAWESARLAPKLENPGCRIDAFDALGVVLLEDGLPVEAASFLRDATSLITVAPEQREFAFTFAMLGEALALTNRLPEASKAIQEAREHLPSAEFWQVTVDRADALVEFTLGNYPRALDLLCPWVETEPGILRFEVARCNQLAARVHAACESRERALAFAQEALKSFEEIGAMKRARETETWIRDHRGRKRGRPRGPSSALTRREHQVLDLVSLGRTNKEIARALSLSVGTVKKHVENMMAKTHSTTRTELAHRVTAQPDSAITRP